MVHILRGYIDESYGGKCEGSSVPKLFNLSCIISHTTQWTWFSLEWAKVLGQKNSELRAQGRAGVSRFHATDFNNSRGEFEGWPPQEKNLFSSELVRVLRNYPFHVHGYSIPLQDLVEEIPEAKPDPKGFAYALLLMYIMDSIDQGTAAVHKSGLISLHHDTCSYNGLLQGAFEQKLRDPNFGSGRRFLSLTPEEGQLSVPLQAADFLAYENFKDVLNHIDSFPRPRRKSLELFLRIDGVRGRSVGLDRATIKLLKSQMDSMTEAREAPLKDGTHSAQSPAVIV